MIPKQTIVCLGTAQLFSWGTSYYLIGVFGEHILAATEWSRTFIYGGFSLGLLASAFASPWAGSVVDRRGGRWVLSFGSLLNAVGCASLALIHHAAAYCLAWIVLGVSMRLTLYDAAFASLAQIAGAEARRAMAQITLLGGLASTTFWPLGNMLIEQLGWKGALLVYAAISLATVPLYLALPAAAKHKGDLCTASIVPAPSGARHSWAAAWLYAAIMALVAFLNSAMSAHMIGILASLGLGVSTAVWVAALRGVGQTAARACDVLFGARLSPFTLNLIAALLIALGFLLVPATGIGLGRAILFACAFGAGNGLMTITRGTLPLVLVDPRHYGSTTGRLLIPSFLLPAAAPVLLAQMIESHGIHAAVLLTLTVALLILALTLVLSLRFARPGQFI